MEMYIFRYNEYRRMNNCSIINISSVSLVERQHPVIGIVFLTTGLIFEILYLPCLISLNRHATNNTCYSLMRYLAVADILVLPICGILTGILAIRGDVFCSSPDLIYIAGSIGGGLYCVVSMVSVLLAFNRCTELVYPSLNEVVFSSRMMAAWFVVASLYGVYYILFTIPIKFTGIYLSWFLSPYVGYTDKDAGAYHNIVHYTNNIIETVSLVGMYTVFCIFLVVRSTVIRRTDRSASTAKSNFQIRSFIQVFFISLVNTVACSVNLAMNHMEINKMFIVVGQFCWICIHGLPPVIYLTLNGTIRRDTMEMLRLTWKGIKTAKATASSIVGVEN